MYGTEEKHTPSLRGEVEGAHTTGPAVASRYNGVQFSELYISIPVVGTYVLGDLLL